MKRVLILGAGFLQTFVIKKSKELGYYTLALDGNPDAVGFRYADEYKCINIVDAEKCYEYADSRSIDGVLTAATDYGVLTTSYIAGKLSLPGLKYETAKLIKNKHYVRECLNSNHVDDIKQTYEVNEDTDIGKLAKVLEYPVIVKPCDGSGSRGINKVCSEDELENACSVAMNSSISNRAEIESFITGREYGVESFVENGNIHILAVMQKLMTTPPDYAELGHAIPSGLSELLESKVKKCVTEAIKALGINFGSVNMDILISREGNIYIVDVGARMGGNLIGSHIVPTGTGICYIENMLRAAVGETTDFSLHTRKIIATRLLALTPGKVYALPDVSVIEKKFGVSIIHHIAIGDVITKYHTNLDGCGYIIAISDNMASAQKNAELAKREFDESIVREL